MVAQNCKLEVQRQFGHIFFHFWIKMYEEQIIDGPPDALARTAEEAVHPALGSPAATHLAHGSASSL